MEFPKRLALASNKRLQSGAMRFSRSEIPGIDLLSNDYLSLAQSTIISERISQLSEVYRLKTTHGATGARLLSGASQLALDLEAQLANWLKAESALLFNSGYSANIGLFQAVIGRNDIVLYDELCHTSIREGIRLGLGKSYAFKHNDIADLESKLAKFKPTADGVCYVVTESLFSMDGDWAPMREIVKLCQQHSAYLIVDEAHSTGIVNHKHHTGAGYCCSLDVEESVFARIHTFGKALGCHGAVVCGSHELINYLTNFSRSFIYTTSLPPHSLLAIMASISDSSLIKQQQKKLGVVIDSWLELVRKGALVQASDNDGPIQYISTPGNNVAIKAAEALQKAGFAVKPVLAPTVPLGKERIRICLHAHNQPNELIALSEALNKLSLQR